MTTTHTYCEGCEADDETLNAEGFCPRCIIAACEGGYGEQVGLPAIHESVNIDRAIVFVAKHVKHVEDTRDEDHFDNCLLCQLLDEQCDECGDYSNGIDPDDEHHIIVGDFVLIGCEGFHTAAIRHAELLSR